jgi:hypothetical protein
MIKFTSDKIVAFTVSLGCFNERSILTENLLNACFDAKIGKSFWSNKQVISICFL